MNFLKQELIEKMKFSIFNGKSYYGYNPSILKSGICKYYRREEFDKFEWCIIEMLLFAVKEEGRPLITNLMNRLKILLMEEISPNEINALSNSIIILENITVLSIETSVELLLEFVTIVKSCKRGRLTSYVNNWWKYNSNDYNLDTIKPLKINSYMKKNDTTTLLKLGELLIKFIDERSESIVDIFTKMYNMEGTYGIRNNRKDASYLFWEVVKSKFNHNKTFMKIYDFALTMFNRKTMKERRAFGVWMCLFVWKYDTLSWDEQLSTDLDNIFVLDIKKYIKNRNLIAIDEDYVVNDYHVNKKFGLKKFGNVGSKVTNEDLSLLEDGETYRQFYVDVKNGLSTINPKGEISTKKIVFKKKKKSNVLDNVLDNEPDNVPDNVLDIKIVDWKNFTNINIIEEGVCGLKVCCIKVIFNGKPYILKEMRKSFNYGRDYLLLDRLKANFNIKDMNMIRIRSNYGLERIDLSVNTFKKNWKIEKRDCVYCMMEYFENIGDLGKSKHFLTNPLILKECLKIRLFDGLFRSSDNILRNILVNKDGVLLSIDEADIYGKRLAIFNKKEPCIKNVDKKLIDAILEEFDVINKIKLVKQALKQYGFDDKINEMTTRFENYKSIVYKELGFNL